MTNGNPRGMKSIIKRIDFDPEFRPVQVAPILKNRVLSAYEEAAEIIGNARREASRLRREAEALHERARLERESERKRGYDEGHQKALGELTHRMVEVEAERERFFADAEPQVIRMVMEIAEKVIGREINNGAIVDVVKTAILQSVGRRVSIKVHPSDAAVLKEKQAELMASLDSNRSLTIKEDETITSGGCLVETEMGVVDARLDTQLAAIRKALGLETI
jgi:flagellar biosynthesis/type III secretory pathway protein FliH